MIQTLKEKKTLSKEQVQEIIDFVNSGKWVDFAEVVRYNGYAKLSYIEISIDELGTITA